MTIKPIALSEPGTPAKPTEPVKQVKPTKQVKQVKHVWLTKRIKPGTPAKPAKSMPPITFLPVRVDPARRLPQLFVGLALYGFSLSLMVRAAEGVNPWSVLYEGLEQHTPLSFGTLSAVTGALVLLCWIPLKQKPTLGTFANIVVLAVASDFGLSVIPAHAAFPLRIGLLAGGIALNGFSVAVYVGARLGPGPRDGIMTGAAARTGRSIRSIRTAMELSVLVTGWLLGGSVGVGTVLYSLSVGAITQFFIPRFAYAGGST